MKAQRHAQAAPHPSQHACEEIRGSVCPLCHGPVERVRRRFIDRLISFVTPIQRYRCRSKGWGCDWEGNLPESPRAFR